jgi:Uma2 family endonuclease
MTPHPDRAASKRHLGAAGRGRLPGPAGAPAELAHSSGAGRVEPLSRAPGPEPEILFEPPLAPSSLLGPYRQRDYQRASRSRPCQLVRGSLYAWYAPSRVHQQVAHCIWSPLRDVARTTGGRAFLGPADLALAEHSVVKPDVFYVGAERRHHFATSAVAVPDLIVEVLSSDTGRLDRRDKLGLYIEAGVQEVWLVDPDVRLWTVDFLVRDRDPGRMVVTLPAGPVYESPVLAGVSLDLDRFWRRVERRWPAS